MRGIWGRLVLCALCGLTTRGVNGLHQLRPLMRLLATPGTAMGGPTTPTAMGGSTTPTEMGGSTTPTAMGGPTTPGLHPGQLADISTSLERADVELGNGDWEGCVDALGDFQTHLQALSKAVGERQENNDNADQKNLRCRIRDCVASVATACQCTGCINLCAGCAAELEAAALALCGGSRFENELTDISEKLFELARKLNP